jgi:signal transduction histidine kinase
VSGLFIRILLVLSVAFAVSFAAVSQIFSDKAVPTGSDIALAVTVVIVVLVLTGAMLSIKFVARLRKLEVVAKKITDGDLSARAEMKPKTAIGDFAMRFNQMADKIQTLLETQKQLVHAVAHELRTPISRVRFGLEMLLNAESDRERQAREQAIVEDLDELDLLVEDLLVFGRYASPGGSVTNKVEIDLAEPVTKQIEKFRPLSQQLEIALHLEPGNPCNVVADPRLVDKVIGNLLSNATRYAKSVVHVGLSAHEDTVLLTVTDDGPGIPADDRARVLEPFIRLDTSRNRESGGFGLGLAIINNIMAVHGGAVRIGESENGGAKVETVWPAA